MSGAKQIVQALALACAIAAGSTAPVSADDARAPYRDDANGFELLPPDGWQMDFPPRPADASDEERVMVRFRAPDYATTTEACVVMIMEMPRTQQVTQADIDRAVRDEAFERSELAELQSHDPLARIVSLSIASENGATEADGLMEMHNTDASGRTVASMTRNLQIFVPGRLYILGCSVQQDSYSAKHSDFDETIRSFKLVKK